MIIQKISKNEYSRVFKILLRIGKYYVPPLNIQIKDLAGYVRKIILNADTFIITAQDDIGLLSIYCNDYISRKAFITSIGIEPNYSGKGIAQKLLQYGITHVKEKGFLVLELEVNRKNDNAINFYKKNAFITCSENSSSLYMSLDLNKQTKL